MGKFDSQVAKTDLLAFHAAVLRLQKEAGSMGSLIPVKAWEGLMVQCLDTMTRQACQDKTWALERMGLIERRDREGVIVCEPPQTLEVTA